ncbi:MAG TPA: hypothetical protein VMB80_04810 [Candidatus Acidoferrum sp.]|nr:hypothetical protein [Candidatus Acidoferrum sp.]
MKARQKILITLGVAFGLVILIPVIHHYQLRFAVEKYIAELKAKGEPMELAQVIPPRLPPEKNSASQFLVATSLFVTNESVLTTNWPIGMRGVAPGKAQVIWRQNFIRDCGMTNSWEDLTLALEVNKDAFNRLFAITNSSVFDFGLQYEQRFEMRITNLVVEKKTVQRLAAKTYDDLHRGQIGPASENIRVMLVLVDGTSDERTAISQLVRIAIAQIASTATWELLQSSNLTDGQLAELQADWSRPEFIRAMVNVLPVEREGAETTVGKWRSSLKEMQRRTELSKSVSEALGHSPEEESVFEKADKFRKIFLWRYWWSYPDELRYLKGHQVLTDTMRQIATNGVFGGALANQDAELERLGVSKLSSSLDSIFTGKTDYHNMLSESVVTLTGLSRKVMRIEVARQTVITAIALKRYQLNHGNYPERLSELMPEFLAAVPLDPVDGQPLRYRKNAGGSFSLYSIGENGKDDGGDPSLEKGVESSTYFWESPHTLDWVWPQPATPEEIQAYYARQTKN